MPLIDDFFFDSVNMEKLAAHGLDEIKVRQVLCNPCVLLTNRKGRRALHILIGTDNGGACIAIPVEQTAVPGLWRPVTAWRCKEAEERRLRGRQ